MKKLLSILLAVAVVLSLVTVAFAAGTGSITIKNIITGTDAHYEIYKILDLESYDVDKNNGTYAYTLTTDKWADFFKTGEGKDYVTIENNKYVTWKTGVDTDKNTTVAEFAKKALAFAKANGLDPVKSSKNAGEFIVSGDSGTFSGLDLGYYLIDSDVGALCGLTTTNPDANITAKNAVPIIDKQVKEDSTNVFGDKNSASIGQTVEFMTLINVHPGAQNFVLHDVMEHMDFIEVTEVTLNDVPLTEGTDYTVLKEGDAGICSTCTFEVKFTETLMNKLKSNDKIKVYYSAKLNETAIIAGTGSVNKTQLQYGEDKYTEWDQTNTMTYGVDLVKTDSQNFLLDGAAFRIYDAATGGKEMYVKQVKDDGGNPVLTPEGYHLYRHDETLTSGDEIVVKDGIVRIEGMDNGTYYLQETDTPEGFNALAERQAFTIADKNWDATISVKGEKKELTTGTGIQVINKGGSMLPETGGLGTLLFTVLGGSTALGTGVVLVTKKRMSKIEDED